MTLYYVGNHDGQGRYIPGIPRGDLNDEAIESAKDVIGAESTEQAVEWLVRSGGWSEEAPADPAAEAAEDEAPTRKAKAAKAE